MTQAELTQGVGQVLGGAFSAADPKWQSLFSTAYGLGSKVGVELPYDRKQESEADHIGIVYMARAGYDPRESVAFWERFSAYNKQQGGKTLSFLSTHPVDEKRIRDLQSWMPEAEAAYKASPR
jgi:predicted Zn-dependent protease